MRWDDGLVVLASAMSAAAFGGFASAAEALGGLASAAAKEALWPPPLKLLGGLELPKVLKCSGRGSA